MKCRHCSAPVELTLVDLGSAPLSNGYLTDKTLRAPEVWYPLKVVVCHECWLAQTDDTDTSAQPFDAEYAYFSSVSRSWLAHAEQYVRHATGRFGLGPSSHVVEVAANDGYLLQYVRDAGIPCTGVEPTASTAEAARKKGIAIIQEFFGTALARRMVAEGIAADLTAANNVLAHVPDINDFVRGFAELLKPTGVATFEFPHLYRLIEETQFDTIYYEHYSYLSLGAVARIFTANGLGIFDVEELSTHGGSLRVYAQRSDRGMRAVTPAVDRVLEAEKKAGMARADYYLGFQARADAVKNGLLEFLLEARRNGKRVAGYGAAAKGNTLLNYAGVRHDLLSFVVDQNPAKAGKFLPGSRIPIVDEARLKTERPDFVVILPWNLKDEIAGQLEYARAWGGRFVTAVPKLQVW